MLKRVCYSYLITIFTKSCFCCLNILTCFRHLACEEEREAVACMLVKAGASFSIKNKEEKTPLDLCSNKLKNMLHNLLE